MNFCPDKHNGEDERRKHIDRMLNGMDEKERIIMENTAEDIRKARERPETLLIIHGIPFACYKFSRKSTINPKAAPRATVCFRRALRCRQSFGAKGLPWST